MRRSLFDIIQVLLSSAFLFGLSAERPFALQFVAATCEFKKSVLNIFIANCKRNFLVFVTLQKRDFYGTAVGKEKFNCSSSTLLNFGSSSCRLAV